MLILFVVNIIKVGANKFREGLYDNNRNTAKGLLLFYFVRCHSIFRLFTRTSLGVFFFFPLCPTPDSSPRVLGPRSTPETSPNSAIYFSDNFALIVLTVNVIVQGLIGNQ